jgi:hypothetical protein
MSNLRTNILFSYNLSKDPVLEVIDRYLLSLENITYNTYSQLSIGYYTKNLSIFITILDYYPLGLDILELHYYNISISWKDNSLIFNSCLFLLYNNFPCNMSIAISRILLPPHPTRVYIIYTISCLCLQNCERLIVVSA